MLRDDTLRARRDDLQRVISSRKRKLSELYYATVALPPAARPDREAPSEALGQGEVRFLDENDITRGRFFDESTLPPFILATADQAARDAATQPADEAHPRPPRPPLRVDASLTTHHAQAKQHSSPISEISPNLVEQRATSPSSSLTSVTAHTATASPVKDGRGAEDVDVGVARTGEQVPAWKREAVEETPQAELARITPHAATTENTAVAATTTTTATALPPLEQSPQLSPTRTTKPTTPTARKAPTPPRPMERMTTRVSSGAIRHKTVSEILGEKPKAQSPASAKEARELKDGALGSPRWRAAEKQKREKERSKLSTVIFPKQSPQRGRYQRFPPRHHLTARSDGTLTPAAPPATAAANEENDYLFTLFQAKAHLPPRSIHLNILLSTAHKILTTADHLVDYTEQMSCRTLKRLYQLQSANRWPLRQLQRAREPRRGGGHWDVLLDHARWMSTDFREERRWKIAAAKACAEWCRGYVEAGTEERAAMRVNAVVPRRARREVREDEDVVMLDETEGGMQPTPELVPSHEEDSVRDDMSDDAHPDLSDGLVPAAIFSLGYDKFTFNMERTAAADAMLSELPLYAPVQMDSKGETVLFQRLPDSEWQTDLLPVTKFAQGKLDLPPRGPPRKKSRYQYYDSEDEEEDNDADRPPMPPQKSGSLFECDKISSGGAFRSPMEFPLPRQEFFDERVSSVWTPAEDDKLRRLVKEYSYNWSLVASCLSHRSSQGWASPQCSSRTSSNFVSAAERRTPWECFERWTSLEPLPLDVARHPAYVKYRSMIDRAQHKVSTVQQLAIQQHQAAGQPVPPTLLRRKTNLPISADRSTPTRHLSALDAIRKLVKKREAIAQKQQHTTQVASQRKINEICQPKPPLKTPQEWARLKQERDAKLHEQYRQTALAQQRAVMAQRLHAHSQHPHPQQLAQHAAAQIYQQQQHAVLDQHGIPGVPVPLAPSSLPTAQHVPTAAAAAAAAAAAGVPMRATPSVPNGSVPRINGAVPHPGVMPAPAPAHPHPALHGAAPPGMSPAAAAAALAAQQQQRHHPPNPAVAMQATMAAAAGSPEQAAMMMKMLPASGMGIGNVNAMAGRAAMAPHTSPADSARILREASRLQEQQRLVQSKQQQQQQQQQQQGTAQPHQQFPHQPQQFMPQAPLSRTSPSLAVPKTANGASRSPSLMGVAYPPAGRGGSPPFPPTASLAPHYGHSAASPVNAPLNPVQHAAAPMFPPTAQHAGMTNAAAAAFAQSLPSVQTLQVSILRSNPKLTAEQAKKIAAEKLQQFQQQRMSQLALNGAVGAAAAAGMPTLPNAAAAAAFAPPHAQAMHAVHANQHPHGHPNGQLAMRAHPPTSRPHTSSSDAPPDAVSMQKAPSQGRPPSQGSPALLAATPHAPRGYSPLMRSVTAQACAGGPQPQQRFAQAYQQQQGQQGQLPPQAMPKTMQHQSPVPAAARPMAIPGAVADEHARSMNLSPTPPASSASPPTFPQPAPPSQQQQQMRRSMSNQTVGAVGTPQPRPATLGGAQAPAANGGQMGGQGQGQQRPSTGSAQV